MKIKNFFSILIVLLSFSANSQESDSLLSRKGFVCFYSEEYDSSLDYLNKIENKNSIHFLLIGKNYLKLDNQSKAKKNLIFAYNDTLSKTFNFLAQEISELLAEIYSKEKNVKESLKYYKITSKAYSSILSCSKSKQKVIDIEYNISHCYYKLVVIDSAIRTLTPFMFLNPSEYYSFDKKNYIKIQEFYLGLLNKKYKTNELKEYLNESIKNLVYKKEFDTTFVNKQDSLENNYQVVEIIDIDTISFNPDESILVEEIEEVEIGNYYYNIESYILFLGTKIEFSVGYSSLLKEEYEDTSEQYTKEYFRQEIMNNYVYKQIMNE